LLRLYEPTSGELLIDGSDAKNYSLESWRALFGVVSQDPFVFNDTILENIRFGALEATDEAIIAASKMAEAHEFIENATMKYATVVGERGHRLSGGERQRLSLARAFVRNSDILVLDEATSSLDSESEKCIQTVLEKFQGKKTIVLVAHRLSTVMHADRIFVVDNGRIVEEGSFQELVDLKGVLAKLWDLQSNYRLKQQEESFSL
jgi:ATP-binding cassette subfamily B protein/subfamily B ATP-binding cassette protein MsbA